MNILYVMRYWPVYGGGETITVTLANEFIRRGHNVYVVYTYDKFCNPMPYEIDVHIHVQKLFTVERYGTRDVQSLHNYIVENHIDIMINQWGDTGLCSSAKINTKCKLITCWHLDVIRKVSKEIHGKDKFIRSFVGKKLFEQYILKKQLRNHLINYDHSDKYIFLSQSFVQEYLSLSKLCDAKRKLGAISNPLTYDSVYNIIDYSSKKKKILFVGRIFEYHKRLSYILKIWMNIESNLKFNDWSLTIVGDGPDMQVIKKMSSSLGLKRISFEGFKDPRTYYNESSIFMMTSAFEGFGMTLLEAQQYAVVPMVMDTYSSLHDIIVNGENGIIIPDNDLDQYTNEMERLITQYEYRRCLAIRGLESCKKFMVPQICDKWELLFNELKG